MLSLLEIFSIIFIHIIGENLLQTFNMLLKKDRSQKHLLAHGFIYSIIWLIPMIFILGWNKAFIFVITTFIFHTITDYYTSKYVTNFWYRNEIHAFFIAIGLTNFLNYIQLITTYYLLK